MSLLKVILTASTFVITLGTCSTLLAESVFVFPLLGERVSSSFGPRNHPVRKVHRHHSGIDLAAPEGAQIRSIASGRVVFSDPYKGYGKLIVIEHSNGITSHYGHCYKLLVDPGDFVSAGEVIATVGSTGLATGPHLHFEIRINGEPKDPDKFIPGLRAEAEG